MKNKASIVRKKPLDYPEETKGSRMAAEIRREANRLTSEQRAELLKEGMVLIYGGEWKKQAHRVGH